MRRFGVRWLVILVLAAFAAPSCMELMPRPALEVTSHVDGQTVVGARMREPYGVGSNGNQVFVTDSANNRVLVWDAFPSASGTPADRLAGQSDFTLGAFNDSDQDGADGPDASDRTFANPFFNVIIDGALVVADYSNGRYPMFR